MDPRIQELEQQVHDLRELLDKKDPSPNETTRMDELTAKIVDLEKAIHPPERKMIWGSQEIEGKVQEGVGLTKFMRAITNPAMHPEVMANVKAIMNEGTPAQGGYAVPEEFGNDIIRLETEASILRSIARIFPMSTLTRRIPRQLTNVTVTWTDEGVAKTPTKPTLDRLTQTALKLAAIVKFSDELLADNSVGIDQFVKEIIANAMALEEDRCGFAGNTDPFIGVLYAVGVNVVAMTGANLAADDIIDLIFGVTAGYRPGSSFVLSSQALQLVMKLKDANGQYLWQAPAGDQPAKIWTYPYKVSDQIPVNLGAGASSAILFGNWKKYLYVSDRGGYEVKSSISATDLGTNESAFMEDETWFRFKRRMSINVALPVAFSRMIVL